MVNTQLKLPCVGSNNFEVFFKDGGAYYVDKTAFLEEILKSKTTVYFFTRPRRFGKSLNLSMIESFLKYNQDLSILLKYNAFFTKCDLLFKFKKY